MRNHLKQSSAPQCLQFCRPDCDVFGDWTQISAPVFSDVGPLCGC